MRTFLVFNILGIILLLCGTTVVLGTGAQTEPSSESLPIEALPRIVLEKCINVQQLIAHNPFSSIPNEYVLVTKYEEKPEGANTVKHGLMSGRALNVYLAHDLFLLKDLEAGIVHDTVLIVKVITTDPKTSCQIVREWIFIDQDGDRIVDRGIFRENVTEKGKGPTGSKEIEFPRNRLKEVQAYYEDTAETLNTKAEGRSSEECVVT